MEIGIEFKFEYRDADMIEVRITRWNGTFGGGTKIYLGLDELDDAANTLSGFPRTVSDTRRLTFGAPGPGFAGGGATFRFSCTDAKGHAQVELSIETHHEATRPPETARFFVAIEAAAVDCFVEELRLLNAGQTSHAWLKGVV